MNRTNFLLVTALIIVLFVALTVTVAFVNNYAQKQDNRDNTLVNSDTGIDEAEGTDHADMENKNAWRIRVPFVNIEIGTNGIIVEAPGTKVDVNKDGVHVKAPGTEVDVSKDGVKVDAPGTEVSVDKDGVSVDVP